MERMKIIHYDSIDSTNTQAARLAGDGASELTVVIADTQTNGRGQAQRSFYSEKGLYMSVILRPDQSVPLERLNLITLYAAVCVHKVLKKHFAVPLGIKWVNDIISREGKVCGILTETSVNANGKGVDYAVVGIGINIGKVEFPYEIKDIAAYLEPHRAVTPKLLERIGKQIAKKLSAYRKELKSLSFLDYYRTNCVIMDQKVTVKPRCGEPYEATVLGISDDGGLMTISQKGAQVLKSADVSVEY